jgi:hypothetical protein
MPSDWYVQHGGKQYGPMTPANLKKLAAEGKITPATSVRLGADGAWVAASRVQGLFAPSSSSAAPTTQSTSPARSGAGPAPAAQPPVPPRVPKADPLAVPVATPVAPPAAGIAPPPWARPATVPKAVPAVGQAIAPKILGAVAIILGAVAMATFWLPMLAGPIGWTAIIVGGLGLLVGIAGLVVAALSNGAGLILNIAGTSSSAVGLVLAVVLGVTFGLFTGPAPRHEVVQRPELPAVVVPKETQPPAKEPEPPPPPEPAWTDVGQAIDQGPIRARIAAAAIEQVRMENTDLSTIGRSKPQPMLKIRVTLENTSSDKIVEVPGWVGGGDLISQGVGQLLGGEAGQAVQAATASAALSDNAGNKYKQASALSVFGAKISLGEDHALRPGQSKQAELVFPPPLETVEYLRLELAPAGFSGTDPLRFQIPKRAITGMPAPAGG